MSPDGRSVAYLATEGQNSAVHVYDLQRGSTTKLAQDSRDDGIAWHPDSRSLGIYSQRKDVNGIFLRNPDGSDRLLVPLPAGAVSIRNFSWAPDGKQLAYTVQTGSQHDIWVLTLNDKRPGDNKTPGDKPAMQPFLNSAAAEYSPEFSPDGRWLAYVSDESGRAEVYLTGTPRASGSRSRPVAVMVRRGGATERNCTRRARWTVSEDDGRGGDSGRRVAASHEACAPLRPARDGDQAQLSNPAVSGNTGAGYDVLRTGQLS